LFIYFSISLVGNLELLVKVLAEAKKFVPPTEAVYTALDLASASAQKILDKESKLIHRSKISSKF
jgi:hypothetical protein